ncbi:uncharacterized protein LOC116177665 [Photinus pyralis]|uniref:uncharacterized protein LOC116177665 n=1 Tax=Photinus pyralis TaxID=7054 RepID=UPI0012677662|nr:uncharacterized protein LOC116177665 [Photinus pyralis]
MDPKQLKLLKEKRQQSKLYFSRLETYILERQNVEITDLVYEQFLARKDKLETNFEKYIDLNIEISTYDKRDSEDSVEVEEKYFEIIAIINSLISKFNTTKNYVGSPSSSNVSKKSGVVSGPVPTTKLPNVNIPTFNGSSLNEYKPFFDLFSAVVDRNINFSEVEKLFYLRSYLKGEALSLITNLPVTNESYKEALKLLDDRYNNENLLINNHIYKILDIPALTKSTSLAIREFVSQIKQQVTALKNLKQPVDSWDSLLVCILSRKLDMYTHKGFQIDRDNTVSPTLKEFLTFLENRAMALESMSSSDGRSESQTKTKQQKLSNVTVKQARNNKQKTELRCIFCSEVGHKIYNCTKFKSATVPERNKFIEDNNCCKLCLNNHLGNCRFSFKCQTCNSPSHNTVLHFENTSVNEVEVKNSVGLISRNQKISTTVLLPTIVLKFKEKNGEFLLARGLVDSCSESSLITAELAKRIDGKIYKENLTIVGVSENSHQVTTAINAEIYSCSCDYNMNVQFSIIDKITCDLPHAEFSVNNIPHNIKLADNNFCMPNKIEFLLNASVFFQILLTGTIKLGTNGIVLQNTLFGYIVSGEIPAITKNKWCNLSVSLLTRKAQSKNMENLISNFWDTEKVPEVFPEFENDQVACENSFKNSVVKLNNRFQVELPLKKDISELNLGDSFSVAYSRFINLEKRLKTNSDLFKQYKGFIDEYLQLGHAEVIDLSKCNLTDGSNYFMAHHPIIRSDKTTTKFRCVFDGSMKTKNNISLNQCMYNGEVVQKQLFDILISFRTHKFVFVTDIRQMYRQILVDPKHTKLLNILWRDTPSEPLQCIRLLTVTYGLRSSPFLATRCLVELANQEKQNFPLGARVLLNETYVDDILTGSDTTENLNQIKAQLINILKLGSFELHKWSSNVNNVLEDIPVEKRHHDKIDIAKNSNTIKTLGLTYNVVTDNFEISAPKCNLNKCVTKRQILSCICKFYDPLGLIGPILVQAKMFMQRLWLSKLKWDDKVPTDLMKFWIDFTTNIESMENLKVIVIAL